jgi:hypothetical protein
MNKLLSKIAAGNIVIAVIAVSSIAQAYADEKRVAGANKPGPYISRTVSSPGDARNHEIVQYTRLDSVTSSEPDFNGGKYLAYGQDDQVGGTGSHRGYGRTITKDGDEIYDKWEGTHKTVVKDGGAWETTWEGKYQIIGGTGKFKNIRGGGKYAGKANADGALTNWEGRVDY